MTTMTPPADPTPTTDGADRPLQAAHQHPEDPEASTERPDTGDVAPVTIATAEAPKSRLQSAATVLSTVALLAYVVTILIMRFGGAFRPWVIEGDSIQTTWQFYRYFDEGVLPLGHLLTDYAWIYNAPLLYRAVMIPFSTVFDPIVVGHVLSVVLACVALGAMYWIGRSQVGHYCGLAAVALFIRTPAWHAVLAGGHARAFGGPLTLVFLGAWLTGRRRLCLVLLILMAASYPPPAMGCSIAFGTWSLWRLSKDRAWRPFVELAITGLIVLILAKSQDFFSPDWWGSPYSYAEVLHHPAFQRGSRMEFVPHEAIASACWRYLTQLYQTVGHELIGGLSNWNLRHGYVLELGPMVAAFGAAIALRVRLPKRAIWLIVCGFFAYLLARHFAFKFHVPTRPIREIWAVTIPAVFALTTFLAARKALPGREGLASILAAVALLGPPLLTSQDGLGTRPVYSNHANEAPLWLWVRARTPKDAVFAGSYRAMDFVGVYGWRIPYVNWAEAHPFRPGYWKEIERRTLRMYEAYWAINIDTVLKFADEEHIDFMMIDTRNKTAYKAAGAKKQEPFPPLVKPTQAMFQKCQAARCVLFEDVVAPAVVKSHANWRIIDMRKLRAIKDQIPDYVPGG